MGKKRVAQKSQEPIKENEKQKVAPVVQAAGVENRAGRIYVVSSYNNTIMSLTDGKGNVIANSSAGAIGFKGTKKSTPFAASKVADAISVIAKNKGIGRIEVFMRGIGTGRDAALRALGAKEFEIVSIKDVTPVPHNGPKAPKVRRV